MLVCMFVVCLAATVGGTLVIKSAIIPSIAANVDPLECAVTQTKHFLTGIGTGCCTLCTKCYLCCSEAPPPPARGGGRNLRVEEQNDGSQSPVAEVNCSSTVSYFKQVMWQDYRGEAGAK